MPPEDSQDRNTERVLELETEVEALRLALANARAGASQTPSTDSHLSVQLLVNPAKGTIEAANRAARLFYGYTREELEGASLGLVEESSPEAITRRLGQVLEEGSGQFQTRHRKGRGRTVAVEVSASAMEANGEQRVHLIVCELAGTKEHIKNLKAREEVQREILDALPVRIANIDLSQRVAMANRAFLAWLGSGDALIGKPIDEALPVDFVEQLEFHMGAAREGWDVSFQYEDSDSEGAPRTSMVEITRIDAPADELSGLLLTLTDISDLATVERKLSESEKSMRIMAENPVIGLWHIDAQGHTLSANNRMLQLLEAGSVDELRAKHYTEFFDPEYKATFAEQQVLREAGQPGNYVVGRTNLDGRRRYIQIDGLPILGAGGQLVGRVGTFVDVTEEYEAKQRLAQSEARYRLIADNMGDMVSLVDLERRFVYASPAASRILGREPATLPGTDALETVHPNDRDRVQDQFRLATANGVPVTARYRIATAEGDPDVWVETKGRMIENDVSGRSQLLLATRDVTREVAAQEELEQNLRFEKFLGALSRSLVAVPSVRLDEALSDALRQVGEYMGVDRAYVFLSSEDRAAYSCTHEWVADGVAPAQDAPQMQTVPRDVIAWFLESIENGRPVIIDDGDSLPAAAGDFRESILLPQRIQSLVCTPLSFEGDIIGFLGFDQVRYQRSWEQDVMRAMEFAADLLAMGIKRFQRGHLLAAQNDRLQGMLDTLRRGDRLLKAVRSVTAHLLRNPDWRESSQGVMEELRDALDCSCAVLLERDPATGAVTLTHGTMPRPEARTCALRDWEGLMETIWEPFTSQLERGDPIWVHPPVDEATKRELGCNILMSPYLAAPVFVGHILWGCLAVATYGRAHSYSDIEVEGLRAAADSIGAAIQREQTEQLLRKREEDLFESERQSIVGRLAGGVAHDFNNFLTIISGNAETILAEMDHDESVFAAAREVFTAARRAEMVTRRLMVYGRHARVEKTAVDCGAVIGEVLDTVRSLAGPNVGIELELDPSLPMVYADRHLVEQVLLSVLTGFSGADGQESMVRVATSLAHRHPPRGGAGHGDYVAISVARLGGPDAASPPQAGGNELLAHSWDGPPVTEPTPLSDGSDLGLFIVSELLERNDGFIEVIGSDTGHNAYTLYIPALGDAEPATPRPEVTEESTGDQEAAGEIALVVDDEAPVRGLVARALQKLGYQVIESPSAEDALQLFEALGEDITLVVADIGLPGMDGVALANRLHSEGTETNIVLVSGYPTEALEHGANPSSQFPMLSKPFSMKDLRDLVRGLR